MLTGGGQRICVLQEDGLYGSNDSQNLVPAHTPVTKTPAAFIRHFFFQNLERAHKTKVLWPP
jgi:hypothetical protein